MQDNAEQQIHWTNGSGWEMECEDVTAMDIRDRRRWNQMTHYPSPYRNTLATTQMCPNLGLKTDMGKFLKCLSFTVFYPFMNDV